MGKAAVAQNVRLTEALDLFLTIGGLEGKTPKTLSWYRYVIGAMMHDLGDAPVNEVTTDGLRAYLLRRKARVSEATLAGDVRGLRAFFRFLAREDVIESNPMARIPIPKLAQQFPRTYSPDQIKRLLRSFDRKTFAGHRAYTMLVLILDTGLRSSECCGLKVGDVNLTERTMTVMGKGRKTRVVPFGTASATLLRGWVNRLGTKEPQQFLFPSRKGGGWSPIQTNSFCQSVRAAARKVGVRVPATIHALRHTFATSWTANGGDVLTLRQILGHARLETVAIYATMTAGQLRDRHDALKPLRSFAR